MDFDTRIIDTINSYEKILENFKDRNLSDFDLFNNKVKVEFLITDYNQLLITFKLKVDDTLSLGSIYFEYNQYHYSDTFEDNFINNQYSDNNANKFTLENIFRMLANNKEIQKTYNELKNKYKEEFDRIITLEFNNNLIDLVNNSIDSTYLNSLKIKLNLVPDGGSFDLKISTVYKGLESTPIKIKTFLDKFKDNNSSPLKIKKLSISQLFLEYFDKSYQNDISFLLDFYNQLDTYQLKEFNYRILDSNFINNFIKNHKGDYLIYNFENYLIRLNTVNEKVSFTDEYRLCVNKDLNIKFFKDTNIIFNLNDHVIDYLGNDDKYSKLYKLIYDSPNVSIKENKDFFKFNFYLPFMDNFICSRKIKMDFNINSLKIDAYFDFNKSNEITLLTKLYIDDNLVNKDSLKEDSYLVFKEFNKIINELGFDENNILKDQSLILSFLTSDLSKLKNIANIYLSEDILNKEVIKFYPPTIRINQESNILKAVYDESNYTNEELYKLLQAIQNKKKFILLKNNIINLNDSSLEEYTKLANELGLINKNYDNSKGNELPLYFAFKIKDNEFIKSKNEYIDNLYNDFKNFKDSSLNEFKINTTLRPFQIEGVKWLNTLYKYNIGGILADDMGLGKTIEVIAFILNQNINAPILIISPTSLIYNWLNEFKKFTNNEEVIPIYGQASNRQEIIKNIDLNKRVIYLTSYDSLRNDIDLYKDISFDTLILDEAQFIKNMKALKSQSVKLLNAKHKLVLTGTPIENSVLDLWSIFDFLMPNYLPKLEVFKSNFESIPEYSKTIKKYTTPFILKRLKQDVLKDLPEKYEVIITSKMTTEQRKTYDAFKLLAKDTLNSKNGVFQVLPQLLRMRQICITPKLFIDNYTGGSGKLDSLYQIILDEIDNGNRLLIFSQFVETLNIIEEYLNNNYIEYFKIIGETKSEDRLKITNEFNANTRYKVVLISLKAGGTGLNLVSANVVIHVDPWWNYAVENQASDRAHRIGQSKNVKVIKLITEDSIEQRVIELQEYKKSLVKEIVSTNDKGITNLSKEDINFILDN